MTAIKSDVILVVFSHRFAAYCHSSTLVSFQCHSSSAETQKIISVHVWMYFNLYVDKM